MKKNVSSYFEQSDLLKSYLQEHKNNEILQYLESHLVRAGIARILGLIEILQLCSDEEADQIIEKLETEVKELEILMNEIKTELPGLLQCNCKLNQNGKIQRRF
jgi:hypothetical protein